jgi:outer membrane protein assembly factor BamB
MVRYFLAAAVCGLAARTAVAQDWPQWRGPQGQGVGVVSAAPSRWSQVEGVVWRSEIEGYGISSPVTSGARVYVTTALSARHPSALRQASDLLIGALTLAGLPFLWWHHRKRHTNDLATRRDRKERALVWLDRGLFNSLLLLVATFGALMAAGTEAIDAGLNLARDVAVEWARWAGRHHTNLWFLDWSEGTPHNLWIISSSIALLCLGLIPFLYPIQAPIRWLAAGGLVAALAVSKALVPWGAYGGRYPVGALIVLYSPVVAIAAWHLIVALMGRGAPDASGATPREFRRLAAVPALLALAIFVKTNWLHGTETLTRRVVCFDLRTGERLWHTDVFTMPAETKASLNSHATPTPSVANGIIVAAFGPGIAGLSSEGRLLWSRTFSWWFENSVYGAASSPVTDGSAVYLANDREFEAREPSRVIGYSLQDGSELWNRSVPFAHDGYATPIIHGAGGAKLMLTVTSKHLVAYDLASGAMVWKTRIPIPQPIPSIVGNGDRLYVTGGRGAEGYTAAYRLREREPPVELWRSHRTPGDVSSPVVYKGRLYTVSSSGVMVAYDASSGAVLWRHRLGTGLGVFYASLVAVDNKLYAVRSNGTTYVVAAEDAFRLISESSLPEEIFASPAVTQDCLLLRTVSALYCIAADAALEGSHHVMPR